MIDPKSTTCTGLSAILPHISHDSANRFLLREQYAPKDLFEYEKNKIVLKGGVLSVDDSILDKPYSDPKKAELIQYHYSGKHKQVVKGICLITLYYTDINGVCLPVNFRLYAAIDGKTKNDYFQEMLTEVLSWGLEPSWVTGDCWYSSLENLKFIRKHGVGMLFGMEKNRKISLEKGTYTSVEKIENWNNDGVIVYLKDFGMVKVFRQIGKNTCRYYLIAMPEIKMLDIFHESDYKRVHAAHWNIEEFHRCIKQMCNIEKFQVRQSSAIRTHIFCALIAFINLELLCISGVIANWYQLRKHMFIGVLKDFMMSLKLDTNLSILVNA